jgi:hypothetical protein
VNEQLVEGDIELKRVSRTISMIRILKVKYLMLMLLAAAAIWIFR